MLLTNPGGPGLPGLEMTQTVGDLMGLRRSHYPVGMDVRGTGGATIQVCPAIDKADGGVGDRDPRDLTEADMTAFVSARSAALKACANRKGSVLPYLNTPNAVRDAVLVMHLMGFRSTDYRGASYGTWYGSAAKKMFPRRFDRVVLDANTDWTQDRLTYVFGTQGESYQRAFDQAVLPWLARHNDELGLGADRAAVNATIERIRAAAKAGQFGPRITPAIVDGVNYTSARDILMSSSVMAVAYSGLNKAMNGDRSHLDDAIAAAETLAKPPTNAMKGLTEANTAHYCNDPGSVGTPAALAARAVAEGRQYPVLNAFQAVNVCTGWVGKAAWTPATRPAR